MLTVQIEISEQLATQLQPYRAELPALLEAGLRAWKRKQRRSESATDIQIRQALLASGKVIMPESPTQVTPYIRQTPVAISGQSVSEIVNEQRGSRG